MASRVNEHEKQAIREEKARRDDTIEGIGIDRTDPTPEEQKRQETDRLIAQLSTRLLQVHSEYIAEGSGAYNSYQQEAVAKELNARPAAEKLCLSKPEEGE